MEWLGRGPLQHPISGSEKCPKDNRLAAADVPKLKLKWAFGFPGVKSVYGQPSVVAGRVFVGVDTGAVYSLDAGTGCVYWIFQAESGVRTAVSVERVGNKLHSFLRRRQGQRLRGGCRYRPADLEGSRRRSRLRPESPAQPRSSKAECTCRLHRAKKARAPTETIPAARFAAAWSRWMPRQASKSGRPTRSPTSPNRPGKLQRRAAIRSRGRRGLEFTDDRSGATCALHRHRRCLYGPVPETTDAILAMDLNTGKILWSVQDTPNDIWLAGCNGATRRKLSEGARPGSRFRIAADFEDATKRKDDPGRRPKERQRVGPRSR